MEVWSEKVSEAGQGSVVAQSIMARGWLGRLVAWRRISREEGPPAAGAAELGEWTRRIQSLSEECDALRRKMQFSA